MASPSADPFGARASLDLEADGQIDYFRLDRLEELGLTRGLARFPYSIKILLESVLRHCGSFAVGREHVEALARWSPTPQRLLEVPFKPARVIVPDFTGATVLVDLAAMRAAVKRLGGDPARINPVVPVDLVVDHSIQVDFAGTRDALDKNVAREFERNRERYEFLRWGQNAVMNFRVVPPGVGIVHQVNLEYLARGIMVGEDAAGPFAYPDTVLGADSHTTMVNALGILGWGVGGIEAEAAMLGQPLFLPYPEVVGVGLEGEPKEGVTATDIALTVTEALRKKGVVDKLVEFFGPGIDLLSLADRASIANMAPEYGATCGYFPLDSEALVYLRRTGRPERQVRLLERYARAQGLLRTHGRPTPTFTEVVTIDLGLIEPSLAGPRRPQDRVPLTKLKDSFRRALASRDQGFAVPETRRNAQANGIGHGSVVIAAITSCTNTSNPSVMIAAGLLARNAVRRGLRVSPTVKTSLAPGSRVVTEYLRDAGLLRDLEALGFHVVGYGCTTCIGNSGPLAPDVADAVKQNDLVVSAVLSGNRNFEARIHPLAKANYLASPPLVVAYALAGTVDRDLSTEPVAYEPGGAPVFLKDLWPSQKEVADVTRASVTPALYERIYGKVLSGSDDWQAIPAADSVLYPFREGSTYVQEPPFFEGLSRELPKVEHIVDARVLVMLGDSITTDHIAPASEIPLQSPAGQYLASHGVPREQFNTYGARRGSHEVSMRGMFASIRLKNLLVPDAEGNVTEHLPTGDRMTIFEASQRYRADRTPLIVLAGKEYGTGSSRDWAAKGPRLLGVRAVIAQSFERIHRANLVGMGILPLQFLPGESARSLKLDGRERYEIAPTVEQLESRQTIGVRAVPAEGEPIEFEAMIRLESAAEVNYYRHGGILPMVARSMLDP